MSKTKILAAKAPLQSALAECDKLESEIARLSALTDSLKHEEQQHIQTGEIENEERIKAVSDIRTKLSMLPHAIEKAKQQLAAAKEQLPALCDAVCRELNPIVERVQQGAHEELAAALSPFFDGGAGGVAAAILHQTEFGGTAGRLESTIRARLYDALNEKPFFTLPRAACYLELADKVAQLDSDWTAHTAQRRG